jgi:hypothetical protein
MVHLCHTHTHTHTHIHTHKHTHTHTHPGKTGAPCVKVPGSSRVPVRDEQTHPHRPRLVISHSTCPPLSSPPHANSFVIGPAVIKHTHTHTSSIDMYNNDVGQESAQKFMKQTGDLKAATRR